LNKEFLKPITIIIVFDIFISLLFIISNFLVWDYLNGKLTMNNNWGPFEIGSIPQTLINGTLEVVGTFTMKINYPFILFWIALVGNLIIFVYILKSKKN
jgi:hypothetical protein